MREVCIDSGNTRYSVRVGVGVIAETGETIKSISGTRPHKLLLFSNETVFALHGKSISESLNSAGLDYGEWIIPDGERFKSIEYLEKSLDYFAQAGLKRTDAVIAFGGGVVGDLAGFAAGVYMRGIRLIQVPTTLLAMVDSSVGGKTAVNTQYGKNLVGVFHQPEAVIADVKLLQTLELREIRAGFYELVKHGAIGGDELFGKTAGFLEKYPISEFDTGFSKPGFENELGELIAAQISQKAKVVSGDQTENPERTDSNSRKILNFGHTIAHALEKSTSYTFFRHGEAVGYGMLVANEIAKELEFCDRDSINLLNDVILRVGRLPDAGNIDIEAVCSALALDKKSTGNMLQWILLERIGSPQIVSGRDVPDSVIRESLSKVLLT